MKSARFAAMSVATLGALLVSNVALADSLNEFSASITDAVSPVYDGMRGNMNIRTDPATDPDVGYVHPTQMDIGPEDGDFIAIGTYNGKGATGCSDSFNASWSGYTDGILGGLYFCDTFSVNTFGVGSNPSFKIYFETGALCGGNRWILILNGVTASCLVTGPSSGEAMAVGLETASSPPDPTDRNIDVKYTNLNRTLTNSTSWTAYGTPQLINLSPSYDYSIVSTTAENFYLAPLN